MAGRPTGCRLCCYVSLVVTAIVLLVIGSIAIVVVDKVIDDALDRKLPIDRSEMSASKWDKFVDASIYRNYYIFNATNLNEVLTTGMPGSFGSSSFSFPHVSPFCFQVPN